MSILNKIIIFLFCLCINIPVYSQVGINTNQPTSILDVNGDTRVTGEILLGGTDTTTGSIGKAGDAILSRGEGLPPVWKKIDPYIPEFGNYLLKSSIVNTDETGLVFNYNQNSGASPYTKDEYIYYSGTTGINSGAWQIFDELTVEIPAVENPILVVMTLQVVVTSGYIGTSGERGWQSFSIGICAEDPTNSDRLILKSVRGSSCTGINNPQTLFLMYGTVDNLPLNQDIKLYVVATYRNASNSTAAESPELVIGRDLTSSTTNQSFLKRASIRADIYEKVR